MYIRSKYQQLEQISLGRRYALGRRSYKSSIRKPRGEGGGAGKGGGFLRHMSFKKIGPFWGPTPLLGLILTLINATLYRVTPWESSQASEALLLAPLGPSTVQGGT